MEHKIHDTFGRVTKEEKKVRLAFLRHYVRLSILASCTNEESMRAAALIYDSTVTEDFPVTKAYALLTEEQRAYLHDMVENPAVRVSMKRDGVTYDPLQVAPKDLLSRLIDGIYVGPPSETQVVRAAGTKAF